MSEQLAFYLHKIRRLRVDRARNTPAPHKPLLLLAILDLIERGELTANRIVPSPQLVESYLKFWNFVGDGSPRPFLPFFHLHTSGFWHLHAHIGQEAALQVAHSFRTMSHLAQVVDYASIDDELWALLLQSEPREVVRQAILDTYFPEQREALQAIVNDNRQIGHIEQLLLQQARERARQASEVAPESPLRSAAFRGAVMKLYDYTCAACRLRILTLDGASVVDAAHIIPFARSHDDGIGNGLALCKLHHWAFDIGLLTLDNSYHLLVSASLNEKGPSELLLHYLQGKPILLPPQKPFYPSLQAISWHRTNTFQK